MIALVVVLFYWKTLLTDQFTLLAGSDAVNTTYAWLHFWVRSVQDWRMPLWDPYSFAGSPFAATLQTSVFYPLRLLFALVPLTKDGMISPDIYHIYLALAHLLCAYFTFALLRELNRSRFAAFTGACIFPLSGLLVRAIWPSYIEGAIWLPAVFLFLLRALRAAGRDRAVMEAAFGGACLGMSLLTGGTPFFFMQVFFALTAVGYNGASRQSTPAAGRHRRWARMALILTVLLVVAVGLGAIQLIPAVEYGHLSLRSIGGATFPAAQKIPYDRLGPGVWPQSIVSVLFPHGFNGQIGSEEYFPLYIGVFPLFLAVIAIWRCWRNVWVRYLSRLSLVAFAYSLGAISPIHGVLYAIVPFPGLAQSANLLCYLVSFALAILSAFGLDALLDPVNRGYSWIPARDIVKWIAIVCATALFLPAIFTQFNLDIWSAFSLLMILCSCGWFVRLGRNPATTRLRLAMVAFILFDLAAFNWQEISKAELAKSGDPLGRVISLRGAAEFVKTRPGLGRVRVSVQPEPNVGDFYGIQSVSGGGGTVLTAYSQLGARDDLLNVRYYIKPASVADPGPVYQDANWKVYENRNAYPRAWIVHQAVSEPSQEAAFGQLDRPGMNLHQVAVLETPLPVKPAAGGESVRFQSYEADRMTMEADARSAGVLVLSEIYYPGWVATVNGKAAQIYPVDGALRGIAVSPGLNRIELNYTPSSFRAGAALSTLTLLSVLAGWAFVLYRSAWNAREMRLLLGMPGVRMAPRQPALAMHNVKPALLPLTSIRCLLALWVVVYHQTAPGHWLGPLMSRLPGAFFCLIRTGYLAVGVFFVLSGFVLAYNYPLVKSWSSARMIRFGVARFARIYPAYVVGLLLVVPFVHYAPGRPVKQVLGALLNWTLLQSWVPRVAVIWNGPGWSLSDEAFFYFCFPFIGVALWRLSRVRSLVIAGSLIWVAALIVPMMATLAPVSGFGNVPATSLHETADPFWSNLLEFNPLLQLPAFCCGIIAARIYSQLRAMNSGLVGRGYYLYIPGIVLELMAISYANSVPYPLFHNGLLMPLHMLIVLGFALGGGFVSRVLSVRPLLFLGNASYAMYIVHRPIADWLDYIAKRGFSVELSGVGVTVLYVLLVIVLSGLVFKFIEEPANRFLKSQLIARLEMPKRWKSASTVAIG